MNDAGGTPFQLFSVELSRWLPSSTAVLPSDVFSELARTVRGIGGHGNRY
jgi:hypothetical protein